MTTGFPQATLDFLNDLAANNEKPWFEANKQRYQSAYLAPAVTFVETIGQQLAAEFPGIQFDTRTNGSGSLMRIYRDVRFSADKTPYKTNIAGMFWQGGGKKNRTPAFGFQLTPDGLGLMAGMFGFDKEQLQRYRDAVDAPESGAQLTEIVAAVNADPHHAITGEQYKKVPRGYSADHPRAELLKYKGLYAHRTPTLTLAEVTSEECADLVLESFRSMAPVQQWLVAHVMG